MDTMRQVFENAIAWGLGIGFTFGGVGLIIRYGIGMFNESVKGV